MRGFRAKNRRRLELIDRKYHGSGLDDLEVAELEILQREVGEMIEKRYPRSTEVLDEMEAEIDRLRARIVARRAGED